MVLLDSGQESTASSVLDPRENDIDDATGCAQLASSRPKRYNVVVATLLKLAVDLEMERSSLSVDIWKSGKSDIHLRQSLEIHC